MNSNLKDKNHALWKQSELLATSDSNTDPDATCSAVFITVYNMLLARATEKPLLNFSCRLMPFLGAVKSSQCHSSQRSTHVNSWLNLHKTAQDG